MVVILAIGWDVPRLPRVLIVMRRVIVVLRLGADIYDEGLSEAYGLLAVGIGCVIRTCGFVIC